MGLSIPKILYFIKNLDLGILDVIYNEKKNDQISLPQTHDCHVRGSRVFYQRGSKFDNILFIV